MPRDGRYVDQNARVLVVDDDPDVRAVAVAALSDRFQVLEAADGEEALQLLDREPDVAVVVTDVAMPRRNGVEVLRGARRLRPPPKVLVMSGFAPELERERLPPGTFLAKPFRLRDLEDAVVRLLHS